MDQCCREWSKQKKIKKIIATENFSYKEALVSKKNSLELGLLNDGSSTDTECSNSFNSTIDLTFYSPNPFWNLSWETLSDPYGSDHLLIIITAYYCHPTYTNSSNQFIGIT